MEKESRDILFLIWSNYTPLVEGQPNPIDFEKTATRADGTDYKIQKSMFDGKQRGGIRRLFVQCDKQGQADFRVQTAYNRPAGGNFDFDAADRYDPLGVTTYTVSVSCELSHDL